MPGFSLAGQRRWATKRQHHHHHRHHHHPFLIFPVDSKKANESGIFIFLIHAVIFPLESKSSSRVGNYVSKGAYIPNTYR